MCILRSIALEQPHYMVADVAQPEQALETRLNGFAAATEESMTIRFNSGGRYFLGPNTSLDWLKDMLVNDYHRHTAASELALIESSMSLLNTAARVLI